MQRNLAFVWALGFSSLAFADIAQPSYPYPYPIDLHANNRAVAFGSALMVESHRDPAAWKKVEVRFDCTATSDGSDPTSPPNSPPSAPSKPSRPCYGSVYYVTSYSLVECEDGRAYLLRSGEGVSLTSPREGVFFGWSEGAPCGYPLPPGNPKPTISGNLDQDRPLDFARIQENP